MLVKAGTKQQGLGRPAIIYQLAPTEATTVTKEKRPPVEKEFIHRSSQKQVKGKRRVRTGSKNVNKILDKLDALGVEMSRTSDSRVKLELPGRPPVFVASTPANRSSTHKIKNDVRKILRLDI